MTAGIFSNLTQYIMHNQHTNQLKQNIEDKVINKNIELQQQEVWTKPNPSTSNKKPTNQINLLPLTTKSL